MKNKINRFSVKNIIIVALMGLSSITISSCKKYLDAKTDKQLVIPATLDDAQALVDNYQVMNKTFPSLGIESDDDYYTLDNVFNSQNIIRRNHHIWAKEANDETDWTYMYQIVLNANVAIETVDKQTLSSYNLQRAKNIKGEALFFRACAFYQLAEYYSIPYDEKTATNQPGIVLRLSSDATPISIRSSIQASWQQITDDYKSSINLLPENNSPLSRPSKIAAYASLARVYLDMGNYVLAGNYADSALQLNNTLVDFNTVNPSATYPFTRYNPEVIFQSVTQLITPLTPTNYKVDSLLYQSYDVNDLRRTLFFVNNGTNTVGFRGSYDGTYTPFNGLATDELYLIRAECKAREGAKDGAMADLNKLLSTRWITGTFIPYTADTPDEALHLVLAERRKELIMRGSRWFDLRRLNKDERFAHSLIRVQNGNTYTLPPNDPRYTFPIPAQVIALSGIQQNVR